MFFDILAILKRMVVAYSWDAALHLVVAILSNTYISKGIRQGYSLVFPCLNTWHNIPIAYSFNDQFKRGFIGTK